MPKTAVCYIRVSTEEQAAEGISLDAQRSKIAAWCLCNDYELIAVHVDAGLSGGRSDNRPGLQSALDQACKTGSAFVVYSLSRLARSTKDTLAISERLDKAGADLVSLSEKVDTTSASGKMVFRLLAVLAEFERDQISERTKLALWHKKNKGQRVGTVPYGFDLDADGVLVPNAKEQSAIALARALRAQGHTLQAIANELEAKAYRTKKGLSRWSPKVVMGIIAA